MCLLDAKISTKIVFEMFKQKKNRTDYLLYIAVKKVLGVKYTYAIGSSSYIYIYSTLLSLPLVYTQTRIKDDNACCPCPFTSVTRNWHRYVSFGIYPYPIPLSNRIALRKRNGIPFRSLAIHLTELAFFSDSWPHFSMQFDFMMREKPQLMSLGSKMWFPERTKNTRYVTVVWWEGHLLYEDVYK